VWEQLQLPLLLEPPSIRSALAVGHSVRVDCIHTPDTVHTVLEHDDSYLICSFVLHASVVWSV
jgi:hypothetical protein